MLDIRWYGALYVAGGLADQPYALMRRAEYAYNVYQAFTMWRNSRKDGGNWAIFQQGNKEAWAIIEAILLLRREHG